ncbi:MAG: hypothetical protein ABFR95_02195 [Actinomycetota bacterium]
MTTGKIVEIRDYHYRRDRFDEYRAWAAKAAPVLSDRLDIIGFWVDTGIPPRIMGSEPMDLPHGSANVTWMIQWDSMEHRETEWEALWEHTPWTDVWEQHPGFDGYLHMSVRFLQKA